MDIEWDKIADLVNKEFREEDVEYKEAAYRKPYAGAKRYFEAGVFNNLTEDKYLKELQIQKQELAKEQVKTRDERNELRRIIREEARKESYRDQILRSISEYQCSPLLYDESKQFTGVLKTDNDLLISCFDVHAGISTKNFWNKFDEDVLKRRFNEYLDKIF